jgi:NADH dehydrogenase FAD-containing subunit
VLALCRQRPLRIAVIGAGATGIELAMAVRHRMPQAALTLLTGALPLAWNYPAAVQQRVARVLRQRNITVLQDSALALNGREVQLGCGAALACDVPLIATGAQAPPWLAGSGLALDAQGFIAVNAHQKSTSHPQVFAAGDVSSRSDRSLARSGVYAVRAGPVLCHNLRATVEGRALQAHQPPERRLNLLSCGRREAIASWGAYSAQGRWVWWWKNWIDRRFIARYSFAV